MSGLVRRKYVNLVVPTVLFGGNSKGLLDWMRFRSTAVPGTSGEWRVCTEEAYFNRARPNMLRYRRLAGPGVPDTIDRVLGEPVRGMTVEAVQEAIRRVNEIGARLERSAEIGARLERSAEIADKFTHMKLATMVASDAQLPEVLRAGFDALLEVTYTEEPDVHPFANASVHLAERDDAITHRVKFPSVWLRFDYDSRLAAGEKPILGSGAGSDPGFAAAFDLHSGMMIFDSYFGPLAGCLSPYIWCIVIARSHGVLVVDFGMAVNGTRSEVGELLHTLPIHGSDTTAARPLLDPPTFPAAIAWWTERLDMMFGVLTDPAVYADRSGTYQAAAHLHALLTIEQLFRRVTSIQGAARDTHASRVILFSVLDTLQRLTGRPIETHCSLAFATKTLNRLRDVMPAAAQDILLWAPQRAVEALERVQEGFFLRSMSGDQVVIPGEDGTDRVIGLDQATAQYLKVIRDATHGHGSNKDNVKGKTNALLAQHDGRIPQEVAGLGFLYMLDVLSRPDDLRSLLASQAAKI